MSLGKLRPTFVRVLKARAAELLIAEASGRPLPLPWGDAETLRPLVLERFGPFRTALTEPDGLPLLAGACGAAAFRLWGVDGRLSRAAAVDLVVAAAGVTET